MQLTSELSPASSPSNQQRRWNVFLGFALVLGLAVTLTSLDGSLVPTASAQIKGKPAAVEGLAPELTGGVAWLNTGRPLSLKDDLRGKVVLLDFWTLCCINCMHIMPDLARLEKKYKNQLVVIGVHSAKFENEKNSESIRKAILRYELKHPVVNDAEKKIWAAYNVNWWPSLILIDPEGRPVFGTAGEQKYKFDALDHAISTTIAKARKNKTLDETPLRFDTAKFREQEDTPLYFPGKVVADAKGNRLFIADSTHHRIVITDLDGKKIDIAGAGSPGNKDGTFEMAQFDDPQGMAFQGDILYVADRKNNTIRQLNLKVRNVKTIAGTGHQTAVLGRKTGGAALTTSLNSPWDLLLDGQRLLIAMSGDHQIWSLNLQTKLIVPFAGKGEENLVDGPTSDALFAQPSGLATDGKNLYVADCEVSSVRRLPLKGGGAVETLVGRGLFDFGDRDGFGQVVDPVRRKTAEALLQHAIGVAYRDGVVYVADTYNSKIKAIDLKTGAVTTFLGGPPKNGEERLFNEPAGLSIAGDKMYVADTNAHRIRVIDVDTKAISTLELKGVTPVEQAKEELKSKKE